MICEYCGQEHDGSYGSGRFCSSKCARFFSNSFVTGDGRRRQIQALNDPVNRRKNQESISKNSKRCTKKRTKKPPQIDSKIIAREAMLKKLTSSERWTVAKNSVLKHLSEKGIRTYLPVLESSNISMIADISGELKKIKVQAVVNTSSDHSSDFSCRLGTSKYTVKNGQIESYIDFCDDADLFAVYIQNTDEIRLFPNTGERHVKIKNKCSEEDIDE